MSAATVMSQGGVPGGGITRLMKQIPSVEVKSRTAQITGPSANNSWTQIDDGTMLAGIINGPGINQRVGRKIRIIGLIVRCSFTNTAGPWTIDLVLDKQANGNIPSTAAVYQSARWSSPPNPLFDQRFQFLRRSEKLNDGMSLDPQTPTELTQQGLSYQKKMNLTVEYLSSTGTVSDLGSSNLLLYANNPSNSTGLGIGSIEGFIRVLYVDA